MEKNTNETTKLEKMIKTFYASFSKLEGIKNNSKTIFVHGVNLNELSEKWVIQELQTETGRFFNIASNPDYAGVTLHD